MIDNVILAFKARWKVFLLSLACQLLITSLIRFGIQMPKSLDFLLLSNFQRQAQELVNPKPKADILESIKPKLEQKANSFELKKDVGWAPALGAEISALGPTPVLAASENLPTDYNQASSYLIMDFDSGKVLLEKNGSSKLPVASLTKIMTAVIASDLASSDESFTASKKAENVEPTKIGVREGEKINRDELLHALLMTSANDSAQMIKEGINKKYGQDVFIRAMNTKAAALSLKSTHFANPQGFDDKGNYSSAEDLAVLSKYALTNYPRIKDIVRKDYKHYDANGNHPQIDLYNWNGLLGVYPGIYGVKIGNTGQAGYTTVVAAERDSHKILVVILGAPGILERDLWAAEALDTGFSKFGLAPIGVTTDQLQAKYSTWKYFN